MKRYITLNNEIMGRDGNGQLQYHPTKDIEAAKAYFLDNINLNTVFFHSLEEKIDYLIENDFYEKELFDMYDFKDVKEVYERAYAEKFRFPSYMSAFKFYNDYALKTNDGKKILERYEDRVSVVALFLAQGDAEQAMSYVELMITQQFQPATPTFLNAGRSRRGELVSCFLLEVNDSLNDINMAESTAKQLSKIGGGVALDMTKIRANGETIKGVEGVAKGVVGVMKMLDHAFRYADQMGQRDGAGAAYLNIFHADSSRFLETKKINVDEDFRVKTLSIGIVIPDKFIELAREDKPMYRFYPKTVYDAFGEHLGDMDITKMYDELVNHPDVRKDKVNPRQLLEDIATVRSESGYPYVIFGDNANAVHANNNISRIKFSNLCVEIFQASQVSTYTDYGEEDDIGLDISCNLGSLNIANVMKSGDIERVTKEAIRALTAVADETDVKNAPAVARANREMNSVGLGAMNLHGYLASVGIPYDGEEAQQFADLFFRTVNYASIKASVEIAKERHGTYYGFEGSTYASGEYFEDYTNELLPEVSDRVMKLFEGIDVPRRENWASLAANVKEYGMWHAYRLAIAPTGSISYVQSATASVMPIMQRVEERTYGNSKTYYPMPGLSPQTWFLYKEAYDMDMRKVIDLMSVIQRHIDQGISLTLFENQSDTTRDTTRNILYAHHKGLKSIYYRRTKGVGGEDCLSCAV